MASFKKMCEKYEDTCLMNNKTIELEQDKVRFPQ